jgi:hypothetical protein
MMPLTAVPFLCLLAFRVFFGARLVLAPFSAHCRQAVRHYPVLHVLGLAVVLWFFFLPYLLTWWPPETLERR